MKRFILIGILLIGAIALFSCSGGKGRADDKTETAQNVTKGDKVVKLDTRSGKTVFELLQAQNAIEFEQTPQGVFITSINGLKNGGGKAWRYYINDQPANVACDKAVLFAGDIVEWRFE